MRMMKLNGGIELLKFIKALSPGTIIICCQQQRGDESSHLWTAIVPFLDLLFYTKTYEYEEYVEIGGKLTKDGHMALDGVLDTEETDLGVEAENDDTDFTPEETPE